MGIHTLFNGDNTEAVLYCSTSGWAFGPVFRDSFDASLKADSFVEYVKSHTGEDARMLEDKILRDLYRKFLDDCQSCCDCGKWVEEIFSYGECGECAERHADLAAEDYRSWVEATENRDEIEPPIGGAR